MARDAYRAIEPLLTQDVSVAAARNLLRPMLLALKRAAVGDLKRPSLTTVHIVFQQISDKWIDGVLKVYAVRRTPGQAKNAVV